MVQADAAKVVGVATRSEGINAVSSNAAEIRIGKPGRCSVALFLTAQEKLSPNRGGPSTEAMPWTL